MMAELSFHSLSVAENLKLLSSSEEGLRQVEAERRLAEYGPNALAEQGGLGIFKLIWSQINNVLVYVLFAAAAVSFFTNHAGDAAVILMVVALNTIIGTIQEFRANRAVASLKNLLLPKAKVLRDGRLQIISATQLVPGDVVLVEQGDRVPADGRLLNAHNLRMLESALTGESVPQDKSNATLAQNTEFAGRANMLWMGTFCSGGSGKFLVTATGGKTMLGQIALQIENVEEGQTHFEKITKKLTKQMGVLAAVGSVIILLVGLFVRQFEFTEIFLFSVAALVAAIPESLPAILTVVLAVGANRMAGKKAIVRKLSATENLGSVTVIATDKTGTLTQNTMSVEEVVFGDGSRVTVSGTGWSREGEFYFKDSHTDAKHRGALEKLTEIGFVSNSAQLVRNPEKPVEVIGDPTEAALVVLGEKYGLQYGLRDKVLVDQAFSTDLKYRASLVGTDGQRELYVVGAAEVVLERSEKLFIGGTKISLALRKEIHDRVAQMSAKSLRVLGIAYTKVSEKAEDIADEDVNNLVLVGFVGMRDPIRPEVPQAIAHAKSAGIRVVMLTGDHRETAMAIGREVGLINPQSKVLTESELNQLTEVEFAKAVMDTDVFARLTPGMKLRIAKALQAQGQIVAMTGDGVNDAPALKQADVGISMGIMGTDTARESSEIVLADDNFATIVGAVEEGRVVFNNIKRASTFLITTNIAEQLVILASLLFGLPLPLLAAQILWLNLVTDGVNDFALALERPHAGLMKNLPRKPEEGIITARIVQFMIPTSLIMVILTLAWFYFYLPQGEAYARSLAFLVMSFTQLFNALNLRSFTKSIFQIGLFTNKYLILAIVVSGIFTVGAVEWEWLKNLLGFEAVDLGLVLIILAMSSSVLWIGELIKWMSKKS